MNIVIVEDNSIVLQVLKAALIAEGEYQLDGFETATAGMEACRNGADLAIFDHRLPDMKGIEAIRRLRSDECTRYLPIIMITADDDPDTRMDAIEAGATDFLRKPLNIDELRIRVRNLLALRHAQKSAAQRENLLKTVIAASGTSLAVLAVAERDERFFYASDGFLTATGLQSNEIIGAGVNVLWRVFPNTEERTRLAAAIRHRTCGRFVIPMAHSDAAEVWIEVSLRPVPEAGAEAAYLVVTLEDISALVCARETNQRLFDRMSDIARVSGAWFFEINSDCGVSYMSDTMALGLGLLKEDVLGLHVDSLPLDFNDPQKRGLALSSMFKPPVSEIESEELSVRASLVGTRYLQVSAVPFFDAKGKLEGFRGYASDVSTIAAARDAAARASRAKSAFLTTMSHEMQTPLTAIIGMADILLDKPQSEETAKQLGLILEAANGLSDVLSNVLDLAGLENDTISFHVSEFDLHALLNEVSRSFEKQASAKGVDLEVTLNAADMRIRRGDQKRVRQILHALVSNAVKFTDQGSIRVTLIASATAEISILVNDTGIGMSAAEIERAFEPFSQVDDSAARKFEGAGMGLSIAHGLAMAMGGRLEIQSICGQGTVARAILPLPHSQKTAAKEALIDLKGIAVLVADDNAANRKILYMMLEKLGGKVTLCEDGDLAIKAWQSGTYHLLLLDINMPRLAGTDVIRAIRQLEAANDGHRIPAIAVTANAGADQIPQYLEAGFDDCLGKPFTLRKLSSALASVIDRDSGSMTTL